MTDFTITISDSYVKPDVLETPTDYLNFVMNSACESYKNTFNAADKLAGIAAALAAHTGGPAVDTVPQVVSSPQARVALSRAGLLNTIEGYMAQPGVDPELKIFWEYEPNFHRDSPALATLANGMGITSEQMDNLFRVARSITP